MSKTVIPYYEEVPASSSCSAIYLTYHPYNDGDRAPIPCIWETYGVGLSITKNKFFHSPNGPSKTEFKLLGNAVVLPTERTEDTFFFIPYYREVEAQTVEMRATEFGRCLYCGCKLNSEAVVCGQCGAPA